MSQRHVEHLLGRMILDEALRTQFRVDRQRTLAALAGEGLELTAAEVEALAALEPHDLDWFAARVDRRIQQASLATGALLRTHRTRGEHE